MARYLIILLGLICFSSIAAQEVGIIKGDIIIKLSKSVEVESFAREFKRDVNNQVNFDPVQCLSKSVNIWLLKYDPTSLNVEDVLLQVREHKDVLIAQHNHNNLHVRATTPNDTQFSSQWAHDNTGQTGGTLGADMNTPDAWDITTGGTTTQGDEIVVAIIDGGFELGHADLNPNLWVNVDEVAGNGIDDDNNGYIDDINGWDAFNDDGSIPSDNHGTHVAGIVGAKGDNSQGVAGINWDVKLMMVAGSSGNEATVIAAYGYVLDERTLYNDTNGLEGSFVVSTNSSFGVDFGDPVNFPLWCAMYDDLGLEGIISAVATANLNIDVDVSGDVPSTCTSAYMIGVTNTTNTDAKNNGAAFGATHIDLGAPGTGILSTTLNGNYGNLTGTSMATPQVAGTIGLLVAAACDNFITDYKNNPSTYALDLKDAVLDGTDPISALSGTTVTGGRLNVYNAITELNPGPNGTCIADFSLNTSQNIVEICSPSDAIYTVDVDSILGFIDPVTLSVSGIPAGTLASFAPNPVTPGNSATLTISNTNAASSGMYSLVVTGTAATVTDKTLDLELDIQLNIPGSTTLQSPNNAAMNESTLPVLAWNSATDASSYDIEIATDASFASIAETGVATGTTFTPTNNLSFNTTYFWRVTAVNACGTGVTSSVFSFTTQSVTYCASSGDDSSEEWIESIDVAGIVNVSGDDGGYADYSTTIIDVDINQSYDFTLTPAWANTLYDEYWMIWIDFNNNGDFTDMGENVYDAGNANQNIQTGSFTIPSTATLGNVRMRITMRYNTQPNSCGSFNFGETEDYTINIMDTSGCASMVVESGIHPNGSIEVIESSDFIDSNATVELGANITYDAANCVELLPNFETKLGSEFEALIEGCGGATTLTVDNNPQK